MKLNDIRTVLTITMTNEFKDNLKATTNNLN